MHRLRVTSIVALYVGSILILTLHPYVSSPYSSQRLAQFLASFLSVPLSLKLITTDFVSNILLFVPLGVLLYHCFGSSRQVPAMTILIAGLAGGMLSFIVELLQMFFGRNASASDIYANTLGTICGAFLSALWPYPIRNLSDRYWNQLASSRTLLVLVLFYCGVPFILSALQFFDPFRIWNSGFTLQIGNEATLDRPWLGKIYFVAIYNRAISTDELVKRFERGHIGVASNTRMDGLIGLYAFNEARGDIVHDVSGFGQALDLVISPRSHVRWLDSSNGIEVLKPVIIRSDKPGSKFVDAIRATDEFSIEVWMTPKDTIQRGPARIVSLSSNTGSNFTLGQEKSDLHFRVRTPITGPNGFPLSLMTTRAFLTPEPFHVVATYKGGSQKIYANGVEQSEPLDLTTNGIVGLGAPKTLIGYIAYSLLYFAPVSFFCAGFFLRRTQTVIKALLMSIAVATALLIITELFQASLFDRAVDSRLIVCGLMISSIMAIAGVACNRDGIGLPLGGPLRKRDPGDSRLDRDMVQPYATTRLSLQIDSVSCEY